MAPPPPATSSFAPQEPQKVSDPFGGGADEWGGEDLDLGIGGGMYGGVQAGGAGAVAPPPMMNGAPPPPQSSSSGPQQFTMHSSASPTGTASYSESDSKHEGMGMMPPPPMMNGAGGSVGSDMA